MEQRDFFISYTNADEAWAVWIANVLKSNGYTVYIQAFDIKPGDDFVEKMEEFFDNSTNFIAVWSKSYSESRFCMKEFRAAFNGLEKEWMNCLLPVRIDNHPLRRLYASLVHVDLSDMSAASETKLMDAVRYAVPRSASSIVLPPILPTVARPVLPTVAPQEDAVESLFQQGLHYEKEKDYTKAREYYEQAAAKGHAKALNNLGLFYNLAKGVTRDYAKARECFEQAAAKGDTSALYNLGRLYQDGNGVPQDYAKVREYWEQAAAKGSKVVLVSLGEFYEYGKGVNVNYGKALDYYEKAAAAGYIEASAKVRTVYEKIALLRSLRRK